MTPAFVSALRLLRRHPVFSVAVVATLAIAIGATAAVFGIMDRLLVRPLQFPEPERIVFVRQAWPFFLDVPHGEPSTGPDAAWTHLARYEVGRVPLGTAEQLMARVAQVSGAYFTILGVAPAVGTLFGPDAIRERESVPMVLSDGLRRRLFGDTGTVVGKALTINGRSHVVSAVMPADFVFHEKGHSIEAWVPYQPENDFFGTSQLEASGAIARLQAGMELPDAQARSDRDIRRLAQARPELRLDDDDRAVLLPLREHWYGSLRVPLMMLFGAAACLLVIAGANVTGLMLARSAARQRDSAIRVALGAARGDLIRESLGESLLLGILAAITGLLVASWGSQLLLALSPVRIPHADEVGPSLYMVAMAIALAISAVCSASALAAWRTSRRDVSTGLTSTPGAPRFVATRTRRVLVVGQIALTVVLLVNGGLLLRSFRALRFESTGFNAANVLTLEIPAVGSRFPDGPTRRDYFERLLTAVRAVPGVLEAGMVNYLPMYSGSLIVPVKVPDVAIERQPTWSYRAVSPDYFSAMRIPLLAGRDFTAQDRSDRPLVAIVDRSAATTLGARVEDVLGRRIALTIGTPGTFEIVGVVGDVRQQGLGIQAYPGFYLSASQRAPAVMHLVARVGSDSHTTMEGLRAALRAFDPGLPVGALHRLDERVSDTVSRRRFAVVLSGVLSVSAFAMSIVALFALMSQLVVHRIREIGVRVAMGARPANVLALVLRQGGTLAVAGVAFGLAGAVAASRLIASQLYGVGNIDPVTYVAVPMLVILVALLACGAPARRALRSNPADVLRAD